MNSARSSSSLPAAISVSDSSRWRKSQPLSNTFTLGSPGILSITPHSIAEAKMRLSVARMFLIVFGDSTRSRSSSSPSSACFFLPTGRGLRSPANNRSTTSPLISSSFRRPSAGLRYSRTCSSFSLMVDGRFPTESG